MTILDFYNILSILYNKKNEESTIVLKYAFGFLEVKLDLVFTPQHVTLVTSTERIALDSQEDITNLLLGIDVAAHHEGMPTGLTVFTFGEEFNGYEIRFTKYKFTINLTFHTNIDDLNSYCEQRFSSDIIALLKKGGKK